MKYRDELEKVYQKPDQPLSKDEWMAKLWKDDVCHADIVSLLAERDALKAQERWIPVEEALPDEGIEVLICRAGHGGDVVAGVWEDGCWRELGCGFPLHGVTHWKDMPEGLVITPSAG